MLQTELFGGRTDYVEEARLPPAWTSVYHCVPTRIGVTMQTINAIETGR
jgi:hypothetical protein